MFNITTLALVRRLLMYTHANLDARDTALGIARWWLESKEEVDLQALDEALDFLVARDIFSERLAADGRRSYRRVCSGAVVLRLLQELQSGAGANGGMASNTGP